MSGQSGKYLVLSCQHFGEALSLIETYRDMGAVIEKPLRFKWWKFWNPLWVVELHIPNGPPVTRHCLRCKAPFTRKDQCPACGEDWDDSADVLPTPAQLRRWVQLYSVDPDRAILIEEDGLDFCFAQELRGAADLIEQRTGPSSLRDTDDS